MHTPVPASPRLPLGRGVQQDAVAWCLAGGLAAGPVERQGDGRAERPARAQALVPAALVPLRQAGIGGHKAEAAPHPVADLRGEPARWSGRAPPAACTNSRRTVHSRVRPAQAAARFQAGPRLGVPAGVADAHLKERRQRPAPKREG